MSKNEINNTNSPNSRNIINNNNNNDGDKKYVWIRWIVIVLLTVLGLIAAFNNKDFNDSMSKNEINNTNSPNSINTIGQTGDNTLIVNQRRVLSENTIKVIKANLDHVPKSNLEIITMRGDGESYSLGLQIKEEFDKYDWSVKLEIIDVAEPPIMPGIKFFVSENLSKNSHLVEIMGNILKDFNYNGPLNRDKNFPDNKIRIYIGSK